MKILIVQLSDMHCNEGDKGLTLKLEKAISALKTLGHVDRALLIFSGDLANTGNEKEYETGRRLIGKFLSDMSITLKCGYIPFKVVPGNHDICLPDGCRTATEIETWNKEDHLTDELNRMMPFFKYANMKKCFDNGHFLYDSEMISFENVKIQVCLLNSAPFSTRTPTDKEFHYLPNYVAEKLVRNHEANLKITIMHHHYEWCEWNTKEMLKKAIASDDITFFGHDHKAETISSVYLSGEKYNIIMGGEFNLDSQRPASFNAIIFDSESTSIKNYEFAWSILENIFYQKSSGTIAKKQRALTPDKDYLSQLLRDEQNICDCFIDYYVFPKLTVEGEAFPVDETSNNEFSVEDIFDALRTDHVVRITGGEGAGKSALLKYLYFESSKFGFVPLLVENRDYRDSKIDKMFRVLFEEQYAPSGKHAYEYYLQIDNASKIIFIDNLDLIANGKARENLVNIILESGNLLIYTTRDKNQDLEEIVKNILQRKKISTININPTYKQTRDNLVEKIGCVWNKADDEIEAIKMSLDYLAHSQTNLFSFKPGNTIQYIKYFFQGDAKEKQSAQTISLVFETNIRNSIINACKKDYIANKYLLVLEHLAKSMYFYLHAETIDLEKFREIVADYNTKKKGDINEREFLDCCIDARILYQIDSSFCVGFYEKNAYAYFVAKALNRDFEKDRTNLKNLYYVMEHICFGINDTILLFLSFIRSNTTIITGIANQALKLLEEYPEWDFKQKNIPFLHHMDDLSERIPSKKERKETHQYIECVERERHKEIKFKGIFDFDENDVNKSKYLVLRALKYTQLVGRALIDQYGALDADEIDMMLTTLYIVPQKVIYATLKPFQDHYNEIIQNILDFVKSEIPEEEITEIQIRKLFGQVGSILALNILNDIAFNSSNESTISVLRTAKCQNANHKLLQLMMEENTGNTSEFISKAISLRKEWDSIPYAKSLIAQIARKHIIYTPSMDNREVDRLLSGKVLSVDAKPSLLLEKGNGNKGK